MSASPGHAEFSQGIDQRCPKCAQAIDPAASFCGNCGQKIEQGSGTAHFATGGPAKGGAGTPVNLSALLQRAKGILLAPRQEWQAIAPEPTSAAQLYVGYVVPLVALAALMSFVRLALIGTHLPFAGALRMPFAVSLRYALMGLVMGLAGVFVVALVINALAPAFGGIRDQRQALKTSAYSLTPAYLGSVLALSPILPSVLQFLAGLYGIYLLYLGLPILMRSPTERAVGYTATVVLCTLVLGGVLGAAMGSLSILGMRHDSMPWAQDRDTDAVASVLGGALGTDAKGKADLSAALSNLEQAGANAAAANTAATRRNHAAVGRDESADASGGNAPPVPAAASGATGADGTQQALGAVGGLMTALGGALRSDHSVDTVDAKSLKDLLPGSLLGMPRSNAQVDNNQAIGVKTASAKADYRNGDATMHLEISDLSGVSALMDIANGLVQNASSEGDSGFETDTVIDGRKVHEKYDAKAKSGTVSVTLVKRFQVELTGAAVDMRSLEKALGQIDLSRLESMQKAGAAS